MAFRLAAACSLATARSSCRSFSAVTPSTKFVLFYSYVPDVLARRDPFRSEHLSRIQELHAAGKVLLGGAWADPCDGAAIIFDETSSKAEIEAFVRDDPYVKNGLVTEFKIKEWTVVVE